MNTFKLKLITGAALCGLSLASFASPNCITETKSKWMPEKDMQSRIDAIGYKVKTFQTTGNCYEIYGYDKEGRKVEIYFNPVDGSVVKQRVG